MAISGKDAARQVIDALPDDASLDDVLEALMTLTGSDDRNGGSATPVSPGASVDEGQGEADTPVSYHLEREGWVTVLVPDRPVPPITAEMVNGLIEEMRREREDRWLGLADEDGA
jgi:hypothetical protein